MFDSRARWMWNDRSELGTGAMSSVVICLTKRGGPGRLGGLGGPSGPSGPSGPGGPGERNEPGGRMQHESKQERAERRRYSFNRTRHTQKGSTPEQMASRFI
ncbi:uncharacterized protein LOC113003568 [Solenopsis invicta]|uniref:uncharacterized protein LOC113003568 n=1 Tax=Solenopsis invicta TaxID=13686 RepID=UPI00193E9F1F|nr:uncharacterized protein LOC113003568 [Solenopsis invicta]